METWRREGRGGSAWPSRRAGDVREAALTLFAERGYWGTSMKDIGDALGMRAPSLYNHVVSKQGLLRDIMFSTMEKALSDQRAAVSGVEDAAERLRRATEAHARLPMRRPREVIVTNREVPSLEEPDRARLNLLRAEYERGFREIMDRGLREGSFAVESPRLAAFAILGMTNEISSWFRQGGLLSEDEIAHHYADMALRLVGARNALSA